jgi:diguanylate cyclase (GGDEF)-like protein
LVEDNPGDIRIVDEILRKAWADPGSVSHVSSVEEALGRVADETPACILLDLSLSDTQGLETLDGMRDACPAVPIVVLTGTDDETLAIQAVQAGAQDYLIKGHVDAPLLRRSIRYAIERKAAEVELSHQALHDPLTGLANRTLLMDRLSQALARSSRRAFSLAVLFLDLDRFKLINDSLGHAVGDKLLQEVTARLADALRPMDTVARLAGDEFVIVCEDVAGLWYAEQIAERVIEIVSTPVLLEGRSVVVTVSIGIAMGRTGMTPEELLREADTALYRAKNAGRAQHATFKETMRDSALKRLDMEEELRGGLERREFRLFYQPIVDLRSGWIAGAEALVRWEHPTRGLLAPAVFLACAEDTGLIVPISAWIIEEAALQVSEWRRILPASREPTVWVNLSARQLSRPDLAETIAETLGRTQTEAAAILLEITERGVLEDAETATRAMWSLKAIGVGLAVDDFGTGYSSLMHLREFPLDVVKIDQSFVAGLGRAPENAAIVAAVIGLAHALGLRVVAEGVETESQLAMLCDLECDFGQGFLFAPPATTDTLMKLAGARRRLIGRRSLAKDSRSSPAFRLRDA